MKRHLSFTSTDRYDTGALATESATATAAEHAEEPRAWRHTLVLRGCLDASSGAELEDEVECLYQEGVTDLRLDLRHLEASDAAGLQTLLALGERCRARGQHVTVLPGAHAVAGALTDPADLLGAEPGPGWPRNGILARAGSALQVALSTTTVKDLARA
jgi:ABC-type transporter Mla MlaB component